MREPWLQRLEVLLAHELANGSPSSPFRPAVLRWAAASGRDCDGAAFLATLEEGRIGSRGGPRRYRWELPVARWNLVEDLAAWRGLEAQAARRHPDDQAARLWEPLILVEHLEWLEQAVRDSALDATVAARAGRLLDEALPTLEDDIARRVSGQDAWADTFLLWVLSRRTRALTRMRGLASAVASRYELRALRTAGLTRGRSFPFFDTAMPSATAHLASAAARIGEGMDVVAPSLEWLGAQRNPDGGWGDPGQGSDLLTTLAVAELMGALDPRFAPAEITGILGTLATRRGDRPVLIGPEWPWVAGELLAYATWAELPFRERFRWPHLPSWMIDEKVAVPRFEGYTTYARLFEGIPGLSGEPVEVAFLDLANFGGWNSTHGQDAGDVLLAWLAAELRTLPGSRTVRDGGDEFLVVGAPRATGLEGRLRDLAEQWPEVSRAHAADLPVVPLRAVVTTTRAGQLLVARKQLGLGIGILKKDFPRPGPEGVVVPLPG